jgi:hypothetical protein
LFIDDETLQTIRKQAKKLVQLSETMQTWSTSQYGKILSMVDTNTLIILHEYWLKYVNINDTDRKLYNHFKAECKKAFESYHMSKAPRNLLRSFGVHALLVAELAANLFTQFWQTGGVEHQNITKRRFCNPLFVYSSAAGDRFAVHYGTNPLAGFHLATALTDIVPESRFYQKQEGRSDVDKVVAAAKMQFAAWCNAFRNVAKESQNRLRIQLFVGDAVALCFGLNQLRTGSDDTINYYSRPWSNVPLNLDGERYFAGTTDRAPLSFNVIDTSNLTDCIGFINLLTCTVPLFEHSPSAVLYTETNSAETDLLSDLLLCNVRCMCCIFGIVLAAYVTGQTTSGCLQDNPALFMDSSTAVHNRLAWKQTDSLDPESDVAQSRLACDAEALAKMVYKLYLEMFLLESPDRFKRSLQQDRKLSDLAHYTRSSLAAFLSFVQTHVNVDGTKLVESVLHYIEKDTQLNMGRRCIPDLFLQCHLFGASTKLRFDKGVEMVSFDGHPPLSKYRHDRADIAKSTTIEKSDDHVPYIK